MERVGGGEEEREGGGDTGVEFHMINGDPIFNPRNPRNPCPRFFRGIHVRGFSAEFMSEVCPRNPCPRFFSGIPRKNLGIIQR
jgi:hypothetical protein